MANIVDSRIEDILRAVQARLINKLDLLNNSNCIVSQRTQPPKLTTGQVVMQVSLGAIPFDEDLWHGGGRDQVVGRARVVISIYSRIATDQSGHGERMMFDDTRGLLPLRHRVLDALADFKPLNKKDEELVREGLQPLGVSEGEHRQEQGENAEVGLIDVTFQATYDEELP